MDNLPPPPPPSNPIYFQAQQLEQQQQQHLQQQIPPRSVSPNPYDTNLNSTSANHYNDPSALPPLDSAALARLPGATIISPDQPVALTPSGAFLLNPRSCVTCRRRKVRCDKQMPCSNCRRAHIQCVFPAPGRAPRRPRPRDPNAPPKGSSEREIELLKRLRKLEAIVEDLSGNVDGEHPSAGASPEAANNAGSPSSGTGGGRTHRNNSQAEAETRGLESVPAENIHKNLGRLVLQEGGTNARYVSSAFLSKLNDEVSMVPRIPGQARLKAPLKKLSKLTHMIYNSLTKFAPKYTTLTMKRTRPKTMTSPTPSTRTLTNIRASCLPTNPSEWT